ncbi:MAG TPA: FAD-dependent oxidoreductase [Rectinemataceae bacterium]|nr:FAD-dependent oxidoreductase [Rectinemataceae bacterium]
MKEKDFDVIVAGGGISGCFAALAAAKAGANVSIVESGDTVGGISVGGPLEAFMTFSDENGSISTAITDEFISRLVKAGGSPGIIRDTVGYCRTIVPYDAEILKKVLFGMLEERKVHVFINAPVIGAEKNKRTIERIAVSTKGKTAVLNASAFVDATGDGNLASTIGASVMMGRQSDGKVQPMTLLFLVAGVDTEKLKEYILSNRDQFKMDWSIIEEEPQTLLHLWGFRKILAEGYVGKRLSLLRSEIQAMETVRPGEYIINYTRYNGDPLSKEDVSEGMRVTLRQAYELVEYLHDTTPGFSGVYIAKTGNLGIRESRRIMGPYVMQESDILFSRQFDDSVALGAFPIDIHQPDGNSLSCTTITKSYNIPSSCLISKDFDNMFMCGRCISATHEAMASTRISATAMATGQASGVMAAMYAENPEAEFSDILERMRKIGATRL